MIAWNEEKEDERREAITDVIIRFFERIKTTEELYKFLDRHKLNSVEDKEYAMKRWEMLKKIWKDAVYLFKKDDNGILLYSGYSIARPFEPDSGLWIFFEDMKQTSREFMFLNKKHKKNFLVKFMQVATYKDESRGIKV